MVGDIGGEGCKETMSQHGTKSSIHVFFYIELWVYVPCDGRLHGSSCIKTRCVKKKHAHSNLSGHFCGGLNIIIYTENGPYLLN